MRQTHAFYFSRNMPKKANFKKILQCTKRPPLKHLSYFRSGTYLFSPLLATTCPYPDIRQAECVNEKHIINVTAGLSMPAVSEGRRQRAYSADVRSAIRRSLTVPGTKPVTICVSSLHVTSRPLICKVHSYVAHNINIKTIVIFITFKFTIFHSCRNKSKVGKEIV